MLVSNVGQADDDAGEFATHDFAQSFTTGSNAAGYTLTSIELRLGTLSTKTFPTVKLLSGSATGTEVAALTSPQAGSGTGIANYTFTTSSTVTLSMGTTYWVVAEGGTSFWRNTAASSEDGTPAAGWSIADRGETRAATSMGDFTAFVGLASLEIRVNGTIKTANNTPTASDGTVTTNEDTAHTFSAANFNFSDTDSGDTLASVKIVTLPASGKGTLELDNTNVSAGASVTKADIDANKLKYTPPANANGTGYASFTFKVSDGTDESASAYTMTINVTAVNDPATGEPTISGTAMVGQTLMASTGGISDADGLSGVSYSYQWIRRVGANTSNISSANSSTYTLQAADEGNKVAVRVTFTDNGGSSETRTSDDYPITVQANNAPEFPGNSATRSFAETVGDATVGTAGNIGTVVSATDADSDPLTYTLEGADRNKFTIDSTSGRIQTKVGERYDREAKASYSVTVKADDERGGTDTIDVTITVTDMIEPPLAPAAPSVSSGSTTSLNVVWNAPANAGRPAITSYDLQYRQGSSGNWSDGPQDITGGTSATIPMLMEGTQYQVRVRATNPDGDSGWSQPGSGQTNAQNNASPQFRSGSTTRTFRLPEGNTQSNIGAPVRAADADNDTLTYSLEGVDASSFEIDPGTGQIKTVMGESYDRTTSYSVTVKADDGNGGTDTIMVTIRVRPATPPPPPPPPATVPDAPSDLAAERGDGEVRLNWRAPNDGGSAIEHYEYSIDGGEWISTEGTAASHAVTGLTNGRTYEFRVRAVNSVGRGAESKPASAIPATVPGAPRVLNAIPDDGKATLRWEPPSDNGGLPVTGYQYSLKEGDGRFGDWISIGQSASDKTSYEVVDLKNGVTYSFRVRAVNEAGAGEVSAEASAEVIDPIFRRARRVSLSVLPEFGRTMARNLVDALAWRFRSALSGSSSATGVFGAVGRGTVAHEVTGSDDPRNRDMWEEREGWREIGIDRMLYGSSFIVEAGGMSGDEDMFVDDDEKPVAVERTGGMGFWGKADYSGLSAGNGTGLSWDGRMTGGHIGIDRRVAENVLLGISASLTRGSFDYRDTTLGDEESGDYGVRMRSVSPYAAWLMSEDVYFWGAVSYGRGRIAVDEDEGRSDLGYRSLAGGGVGKLFDEGDMVVSLRGEAFKVWMDVEGDEHMIDDLSVGVYQARLGVEGSYEFRFASGARLSPVVEVGIRRDGGDGKTGAGLEVGGGFLYENPDMGLSVSGRGRWLAAHGSGKVKQWGVGGEVLLDAGADGRGMSFSAAPGWGDASSGVESLWERGAVGLSSVESADMHLDAELGYGLSAMGGDGLVTPYSGMRLGGGGWRHYRLGGRVDVGSFASVSLETERRQSDNTESEHGIILRGEISF